MKEKEIIRNTYSVCPVCLKRLPARHVRVGSSVYMQKDCPEHGEFSTIIWRGYVDMSDWIGSVQEMGDEGNPNCPKDCGLCSYHAQDTCCTLLEVTDRCNLNCRFCFADNKGSPDPTLEQIRLWLNKLARPGETLVQLSGGEPTVRDDLPQIVAAAKEAGCKYVQLNSNGIRLAQNKEYLEQLAQAGLSFVFMQFDGTEEEIYQRLRGRRLLEIKQRAIENCADYNIGVTLVPTLVPGVNTHNIGDILRFALSRSPVVRGVHFQPVSYFGRTPGLPEDDMRFTIDELLINIKEQAGDLIKLENIIPSRCNHPLCGFHSNFVVMPDGPVPLSHRERAGEGCCGPTTAKQNRAFISRRWQRQIQNQDGGSCYCSKEPDINSMEYFLQRVKTHGFTVTAMAFQDAGNIDLERLRRCSLHVFDKDRFVPFCSYYLSRWQYQ